MTITLASLVARLEADVPAVDGVPSTAQYAQAVKDAVADLSRRASVTRRSTISVLAGTADYALPADFQKLIRLAAIGAVYPSGDGGWELGVGGDPRGGTIVTPAGLVPFTGTYREQVLIAGDTLTIYPTPQTSADRQLVYAAGDALVDDAYSTLTEDRAAIALLLATATCIERQATASGSSGAGKISGLGYTIDSSAATTEQRIKASGLREQYLAAIQSLNAGIGGLG